MSLIRLTRDLFENFTIVARPSREFISSSAGTTGSIYLDSRRSTSVKDVERLGTETTSSFSDGEISITIGALRDAISSSIASGGSDNSTLADLYLTEVNDKSESALNSKQLLIERISPAVDFGSSSLKKSNVVDVLMPYYRHRYPTANFAYTNYNSLNFFTASSVPSDSVIIYPNPSSLDPLGEVTRPYSPSGSFSIEFFINPRYKNDEDTSEFKAGTILHLSSTFAVSLATGSRVDAKGRAQGFRLILQASHSADYAPSLVDTSIANNARSFPNDLTFVSDDNALIHNKWHHVAIRWGTSTTNAGSGSFFVDGVRKGQFNIPSSSVSEVKNNDALFVGNFYEGSNDTSSGTRIIDFFNTVAAANEGVESLSAETNDPAAVFAHPLNAEIHDLSIFNKFRSTAEILSGAVEGIKDLSSSLFYLPPYFVRETRRRDIQISPFKTRSAETYDPFNIDMAYASNGHLINLEGFVREFKKGVYPRLFKLTASLADGPVEPAAPANKYLWATGSSIKRNLTILPCDNGTFAPNFEILASGTFSQKPLSGTATEKFVTDYGNVAYSLVTLKNLIPTASLRAAASGAFDEDVEGVKPEKLDAEVGDVLAIYNRTRDNSSNRVVLFNVSNAFYDNQIQQNTFSIKDSNLTGSDGKISIRLRDDGNGNLYRADADTPHATWSSVGNVFYNEGVVLVKTPHLPLYGKDAFTMNFKGESSIHVLKINIAAPAGFVNSSSNPSYKKVSASLNANDQDTDFVYITGITLHDENLNVVARTQFAQPILKRSGDRILFRPKIDF